MSICYSALKIITGCIGIFLVSFDNVKIADEELMIIDIKEGRDNLKLFFKHNWMHKLGLYHHNHHHQYNLNLSHFANFNKL
jgi:hypothetical protein